MKIIKVILFTGNFFMLYSCNMFSGNSKQEKVLFQKIKPGMTIKDVKGILGNPDWVDVDSSSNNNTYYYYFTENKSVMRSDLPTVIFDSSGVVTFSSYN